MDETLLRQGAFTKEHRMLKGGLHCHTTRSDGDGTPEEVMRYHKEHGYDFLAITDHRRYNRRNFVPELGLTIIPAMEVDYNIPFSRGFRCYHTVVLGPDDETNLYQDDKRYECEAAPTQEVYQQYLDRIHEKGNITFLCHPQWSGTDSRFFDKIHGNFAMEVWNTGCAFENDMDINDGFLWDQVLSEKEKIYAVAVDDGHGMNQHCHGWVMVNAENKVTEILKALEEGRFYASCGPVITDFYVQGNTVHVEAEDVNVIRLCSAGNPSRKVVGNHLTQAEFTFSSPLNYVRVEVEDSYGRTAWTNPIFL